MLFLSLFSLISQLHDFCTIECNSDSECQLLKLINRIKGLPIK